MYLQGTPMANLLIRKKRLTKSLLFLALMFISNVHAQVVRYSEVVEKEEQEQIRVVGTLKAYQTANIAISESGLVTQVLVNDGDYVKKGDQLLKIDDRRLMRKLTNYVQSMLQQNKTSMPQKPNSNELKVTIKHI